MRILNEHSMEIAAAEADLSLGRLVPEIIIRENAAPIDNVVKFAWADDDYESILRYIVYSEAELFEKSQSQNYANAQSDAEQMLIDHEYRLTLLELGINESEV